MSADRTPRQIIGDDAYMQLVFEGYEVIAADTLAAKETALAEMRAMSDAHREHAQSAVENCASLNRLLSIAEARAENAEAELEQARKTAGRIFEEHMALIEERNALRAELERARKALVIANAQLADMEFLSIGGFMNWKNARALGPTTPSEGE